MKIAALYSGGKDSTLALFKAMKEHKVCCLITLIPKTDESYMFHFPNIELTKLQAKCMKLPIITKVTKGEKEKELEDLEEAIKEAMEKFGIEGIVCGAVKSNYQYKRVKRLCEKLNLNLIAPLWQEDEEKILKEIVKENFEVIITGIAAYPLTKELLGKKIDEKLIKFLKTLKEKYQISLVGEGGEFETLVLDAPLFKKRIVIEDFEIAYKNYRGFLLVKKASLIKK